MFGKIVLHLGKEEPSSFVVPRSKKSLDELRSNVNGLNNSNDNRICCYYGDILKRLLRGIRLSLNSINDYSVGIEINSEQV